MLVVGFYLLYAFEFLIRWAQHGSRSRAYYAISFEKEAYAHERDFQYLTVRQPWGFRVYWR